MSEDVERARLTAELSERFPQLAELFAGVLSPSSGEIARDLIETVAMIEDGGLWLEASDPIRFRSELITLAERQFDRWRTAVS